jgi:hypothetical protein
MTAPAIHPMTHSVGVAELVYQASPSGTNASSKVAGRIGSRSNWCKVSLVREPDQMGDVIALRLAFRCPAIAGGSDLLQDSAPEPGYQPFMFAASDLRQGADKSAFGATRSIHLPRAGLSLKIVVNGSHVVVTGRVNDTYKYKISYLSLSVSTLPRGK